MLECADDRYNVLETSASRVTTQNLQMWSDQHASFIKQEFFCPDNGNSGSSITCLGLCVGRFALSSVTTVDISLGVPVCRSGPSGAAS